MRSSSRFRQLGSQMLTARDVPARSGQVATSPLPRDRRPRSMTTGIVLVACLRATARSVVPPGDDDVDLAPNQLGRELREAARRRPRAPRVLDDEVFCPST